MSQFIALYLFARDAIGYLLYFALLFLLVVFPYSCYCLGEDDRVYVSTLVSSLFDSKDPDHLYFVHISLILCSSLEQTEQPVGIPGKKLKEAHPEVRACNIITAWLETTGQSPECK